MALAACAQSHHQWLDSVWDSPLDYDGRVYELTIYPYDLFADPERYIMCLEPCSRAEAQMEQVVIWPRERGAYNGMNGQNPVEVRAAFRADCFRPGSFCIALRPFVFEEVE